MMPEAKLNRLVLWYGIHRLMFNRRWWRSRISLLKSLDTLIKTRRDKRSIHCKCFESTWKKNRMKWLVPLPSHQESNKLLFFVSNCHWMTDQSTWSPLSSVPSFLYRNSFLNSIHISLRIIWIAIRVDGQNNKKKATITTKQEVKFDEVWVGRKQKQDWLHRRRRDFLSRREVDQESRSTSVLSSVLISSHPSSSAFRSWRFLSSYPSSSTPFSSHNTIERDRDQRQTRQERV